MHVAQLNLGYTDKEGVDICREHFMYKLILDKRVRGAFRMHVEPMGTNFSLEHSF